MVNQTLPFRLIQSSEIHAGERLSRKGWHALGFRWY